MHAGKYPVIVKLVGRQVLTHLVGRTDEIPPVGLGLCYHTVIVYGRARGGICPGDYRVYTQGVLGYRITRSRSYLIRKYAVRVVAVRGVTLTYKVGSTDII